MVKATVLVFVSLLLSSCMLAAPSPTQAPLPTLAVTYPGAAASSPSPTLTTDQTAAAPTDSGHAVSPPQDLAFSDHGLGISFTHPPDWEILPRAPDDPPGVTLHGPSMGQGPEPIIFAITVDLESVTEKSVKDIVDQQLEQVPADLGGGIKRGVLKVGGEAAEQVIGLPAREGALETFVIHNGQLFLIILQPYDESNESLLPYLNQVRSVYGGLLSSWKFLK